MYLFEELVLLLSFIIYLLTFLTIVIVIFLIATLPSILLTFSFQYFLFHVLLDFDVALSLVTAADADRLILQAKLCELLFHGLLFLLQVGASVSAARDRRFES